MAIVRLKVRPEEKRWTVADYALGDHLYEMWNEPVYDESVTGRPFTQRSSPSQRPNELPFRIGRHADLSDTDCTSDEDGFFVLRTKTRLRSIDSHATDAAIPSSDSEWEVVPTGLHQQRSRKATRAHNSPARTEAALVEALSEDKEFVLVDRTRMPAEPRDEA